MPACLKDFVNVIFSRIDGGFCSLNHVPLAGSDLELDLVLYRITKLVLKARLNTQLFYAFSRTLFQGIRISTEYLENLSLLSETFLLFNTYSFYGRMWFLPLNPLFELIDVLAFLGQEIEVSLKVGIND